MPLTEKQIYEFGPFLLDPVERILSCGKTPVTLTPKAFETLLFLLRNPGRLISKDELLKQIWPDSFVEEINLAVNISTIRKALGENPRDCRYIATVAGRGYRFIAQVRNLACQNGNGADAFRETRSLPSLERNGLALVLAVLGLALSVAVVLGKHRGGRAGKLELCAAAPRLPCCHLRT